MVTLITPTGNRFQAFALMETYMSRQTMKFDQWIVVDDCENPTPCNLGQEVVRREPFWKKGDMTLPLNILAALPLVKGEYILIIEDDDWYHPDYIKTMVEKLQNYDLVGGGLAHHYNVSNYRHRIHKNSGHASLCQTGFRNSVKDSIQSCIESNLDKRFIDMHIWKLPLTKLVFTDSVNCVGMRNMPIGRLGIGGGHDNTSGRPDSAPFETLRKWIGDDVKYYENLKWF
jgi:glycosyltransferase involved in cell wall biosynthesis